MVTFPEFIRPPELIKLIGAHPNHATGLQGAHLVGDDFWDRSLPFLDELGFGLEPNAIANGSLSARERA